jgi:hypothetical protein
MLSLVMPVQSLLLVARAVLRDAVKISQTGTEDRELCEMKCGE